MVHFIGLSGPEVTYIKHFVFPSISGLLDDDDGDMLMHIDGNYVEIYFRMLHSTETVHK